MPVDDGLSSGRVGAGRVRTLVDQVPVGLADRLVLTPPALGTAWRDRMRARQAVFASMVDRLQASGELDARWQPDDAVGVMYAIAHYDTWRELFFELGWPHDRYVNVMSHHLRTALLRTH